jgi:hypothetical protein
MSRTVRIRGDVAVYPANACVSCLRPATCQLDISRVKGHSVRRVRAPFCDACAVLRQQKTARQIRFERMATINSLFLSLAVGLYVYMRVLPIARSTLEVAYAWVLLLAALGTLTVFGLLYGLVEPWSRRLQSTETKNALRAVTIVDFDWETTTLEFRDDEYGEQFARANGARELLR